MFGLKLRKIKIGQTAFEFGRPDQSEPRNVKREHRRRRRRRLQDQQNLFKLSNGPHCFDSRDESSKNLRSKRNATTAPRTTTTTTTWPTTTTTTAQTEAKTETKTKTQTSANDGPSLMNIQANS